MSIDNIKNIDISVRLSQPFDRILLYNIVKYKLYHLLISSIDNVSKIF